MYLSGVIVMVKASALYIVIIVSLLIAIFSASLISTAYFYRLEYQKYKRYNKLSANLNSGIAILLSDGFKQYGQDNFTDLFGEQSDSVLLRKERWGVYDLNLVKSFVLADTLKKSFLSGKDIGKDQSCLWLSDEDRPLSVSGSTRITGDAFLPKSGIKQAYVEGKPYDGKKTVYGSVKTSEKELPALDENILRELQSYLASNDNAFTDAIPDSSFNSFFNPAQIIKFHGGTIGAVSLSGKIILVSDTIVTIPSDALLNDIQLYAPSIIVEEGFKGICQLFAADSIHIGNNCIFNYPSCLGVLKQDTASTQSKIDLGKGTVFSGIIFSYEKQRSDLQTLISLGKNSQVKGEVYATGFVKMDKPVKIQGKVSCNRFIIQTPTSLYENYLIDIEINRKKRSKYYLGSTLFPMKQLQNAILKWLN